MHALVCPLCRIALPPTELVCPRDGRPGSEVAWIAVPVALRQRFQVIEPFAHGNGGSLYLADDPETGRRGLLKLLQPATRAPQLEQKRLRRELVKQTTLAHTHLVVPYATGDTDGLTWFFREWLDGLSLEVRLSRDGPLPQPEALSVAAQLATALDELHRGGLLHRDVKPGHIILFPTSHGIPRAALIDAGVASSFTAQGAVHHGTPGYVAPEQLLGSLVSFRSDLYSLGAVLYRMLTGRPAFRGETTSQLLEAQRVGELPPMPSSLPPGIRTLLQSILARDPQERPFSAQKLRRTLEPFLPDGALMEKQSTSTFEVLPEGPPSGLQPSGTLRPPAPSTPAAHLGTQTLLGSSALQQAAAAAKREREDRTEQIELLNLEELSPVKVRSAPPPPPPGAGISERTQPIRLDQILAVADSRRAAANRPPARPVSERPPAPPPSERPPARPISEPQRGAATRAPFPSEPPAAGLFATRDPLPSPALTPHGPTDAPATHDNSAHHDAVHGDDDATPLGGAYPAAPSDNDDTVVSSSLESLELDSVLASAEVASRPTHKKTLIGMGVPATSFPESVLKKSGARERDITTEPMEVLSPDEASSPGGRRPFLRGALPLSTNTRLDSRHLMLYARMALVGLGVLAVGVSALSSRSPTEVAETATDRSSQPPPLPVAATPRAIPAVVEAREPTTEPLAERAEQAAQPKAAAPQVAERTPTSVASPARTSAPSARTGAKARPAEPARVSKSSPAKPAEDKRALFAAAREEARTQYAAKRYKQAAAAYERAARYDPTHAGTFAGLGAARLQTGDYQGAIQAYQRAAQLSPDTAGFQAALGRAYLSGGDKTRARAAYKRALALDPNNETAKNALRDLGR